MPLGLDEDQRLSDLMTLSQGGDKAAYTALLKAVAGHLSGFFARRMNGAADAEDVVQEVLIAIHAARHTFGPGRRFGPWMYAIARHRLADYWRKHLKALAPRGVGRSGGRKSPKRRRSATRSETRSPPPWGLLPDRQREIVSLLKLEGHSLEEVAVRTGLSVPAVKVTAHRAYGKMRKWFEENDDVDERSH
jgi:DNA-directed RNA polymerase specialized sigma24 family protein